MLPAGSPLSTWLTWLETLSPNEIELGLERVREVLARLNLEFPEYVITVGGTNGKGSTVAMAGALLRAAGYTTGTYTSPHIVDYNERIVVGTDPAGDDEIVTAFESIETVRNGVPLTTSSTARWRRSSYSPGLISMSGCSRSAWAGASTQST
jgi:dihydrofolate synthase/folylpolyglutamate synthase